ncbi:energy transducer TonB [Shewanella sp. A32]|uniref:energy transducer TonB n=1 Tax=Shewanella sp. A32 TaxID=3031327 RepID=UPI0023B8CE23|nr:energy transducer TonB [Shewanella sp. A32]MDF0533096.1 energy transducer TonB [Shewanella sp. A32]
MKDRIDALLFQNPLSFFSRKALHCSLLVVLVAMFSSARADDNQFHAAYEAYKSAVQSQDNQQILTTAEQVYKLGRAVYAKDSLDFAALTMNWAQALSHHSLRSFDRDDDRRKQANVLYQQALKIYQQHYGDDSVKLVDALLGMAKTEKKAVTADTVFRDAIDIAEESKDQLLIADVKMVAFHDLYGSRAYTRRVRDYAFEAYEIYKDKLAVDAISRVETEYEVAKIHFVEKDYTMAEPLFLDVVQQFSALQYSHPYALSAHAMLVRLYQQQNSPDKATEHCQAIGRMTPWQDNQEQTPIFRAAPQYPQSVAKRGQSGWVQLEFTIDESGFVKDPKVLQWEGSKAFEAPSIKALKQWRYAPKFENGEPVAAISRVQLDYKINR